MKKRFFKLLSVIMAVAIMAVSLPMTTFAMAFQSDGDTTSELPSETNSDVYELTDMRTANTKYFRLDDGTYYLAQYNTDVHYMDGDGNWWDIDNTLTESGSEVTTSNAKIKFAKKTTGNGNIFTLHDGNTKLTLSMNGAAKKVEGKVTNHETEWGEDATQLQKMTTLDKLNASILYENVLPNVDLEYIVSGLDIKENIIVKQKAYSYMYSFTMELNNLVARASDDGGIIISDSSTGERVYTIPAPVMWDAEHTYSDRVTMSLTDNENGKYTITVTADSEWMNAEDRAYPVTIDPPVYADTSTGVTDITVSTTNTGTNYSSSTTLQVSNTYRSYWKTDLSGLIPNGAYVVDAEIAFVNCSSGYMSGYIAAYDVTTSWSNTLTWAQVTNSLNPQGVPATNFISYEYVINSDTEPSSNTSELNLNITPLVKRWVTDSTSNRGIMLAPVTGTTFEGTASFYSNDYSIVVSSRPSLCIQYCDMKGLEDYWSYTSQSAGFAGSGSVNNATGKLVFTIPTVSSIDSLLPMTPTLVYDSTIADTDYAYPSVQTSYASSYMPKGFKLNITETLVKKSYTTQNGTSKNMFIWADGDGTEHYFMPTSTSGTYEDEDGLLLTLKEESSVCTITDINHNVRTFSSMSGSLSNVQSRWYLTSIADKSGNKVLFSFDTSYRPIKIDLIPYGMSAITQLQFSYNTDGKLYAVWNPNSGYGTILRYCSEPTSGGTVTSGGTYLRNIVQACLGFTASEWESFYNTNSNTYSSDVSIIGVAEYIYTSGGYVKSVTNKISG